MASLNKVILIGRLVSDPELRYTASGLAVANFRIAVDRPFKDKDTGEKKTDFFTCKAWRQRAEFVSQYVAKGRLVAVEGRVELNEFVGQDGVKKYFTEISVDQVETLDSQRDRAGDAEPAPVNRAQNNGGNANNDDNGYFADDEPAPARRPAPAQAQAQAAPQRPAPAPAQAAPAAPAKRPVQPAYPAEDDFDDSDPFADE